MNNAVFRIQKKLFLCDKGMLAFYSAGVAVSGIIIPFFSRSLVTSFLMAAFFTTMWLKPMLAESIAGEREKETLESLLSTPIRGKSVLFGKLLFHVLFAFILFAGSMLLNALTYVLCGYPSEFSLPQWLGVLLMAVANFSTISLVGIYLSATSADLRTANGRVSAAAYPLGLIFIVFLSTLALNDTLVSLIIGGLVAAIYLIVGAIFGIKAAMMQQQRYYENIKIQKIKHTQTSGRTTAAPKSQFETVLRHELRYFKTIKSQTRRFILLCSAIVLCAFISKLIGVDIWGLNYFDLTVLLILFGVPSGVRTMVSYSIGGERAYKTGESLLSTPLHLKTVFLAKCALPMIIATGMTVIISLLTLTGVNIIGRIMGSTALEFYSVTQIILLLPGGLLSCVAMIFANGISSILMKTARAGLYASTLIQLILFIPVALIIYLALAGALLWAIIYAGALLLINIGLLARVSGNIRRSWLMGRL